MGAAIVMEMADLTGIMGYYYTGDDDKLLSSFQCFSPSDWVGEFYEWKRRHAQEFSDFLQHVISLLPPSTPLKDVLVLCENYILPLAHLPAAPDLAAQALVGFWNRKRAAEDGDVVHFLTLLMENPDNERVAEIAQNAVGIAEQLNGKQY